jgi:RHS repeat-associated protein
MMTSFQLPASSSTYFAAYDGNGNVAALVHAPSSMPHAHYEYGPFGEPLRITGPAAALNPFRFSTKRTDPTTDLVLYEYRVYSPGLGRWVSRDPINELGFKLLTGKDEAFDLYEEKNLYASVRNRPVNYIDALGNGLCICVFKGPIGKLTVNSNCRGVLSMWVIDEYNAPAAGATAGTTVSADGFVVGGTTYKIDGSTCVEIDCAGGTVTVSCCVNSIA